MKYIVKMMLEGRSYLGGMTFTFADRIEALDFAETAQYRADEGVLSGVTIDIIREEAEA